MKITKEEKALYVKCLNYLRHNYSIVQLRNPKNFAELNQVLRYLLSEERISADDCFTIIALSKKVWLLHGLEIFSNPDYRDYERLEEFDEVQNYV